MMFQATQLKWSEPTEHVEMFAGVAAITQGEWKDFPNPDYCASAVQERRSAVALDLSHLWPRADSQPEEWRRSMGSTGLQHVGLYAIRHHSNT